MANDKKIDEIDVSDFDEFQPVDVSDFDTFENTPIVAQEVQAKEPMNPLVSTAIGATAGGALGTAGKVGLDLADEMLSDRLTQAAIGVDTTPTGTKIKGDIFKEKISDTPTTGLFSKKDLVKTAKEFPLTDTVKRGKEVSKELGKLNTQKTNILTHYKVDFDEIKSKDILDTIKEEIHYNTDKGSVQRSAALNEYKKIVKELGDETFDPKTLEKIKDSIKFENITIAEKPGVSEGRNLARQSQRRVLRETVEDSVKKNVPEMFDEYMDLKSKQGQLGQLLDMAEESYKGKSSKLVPTSGIKELAGKYYEKTAGLAAKTLKGAAKVGKALPLIGTAIGAAIGASEANAGEGVQGAIGGAAESFLPLGFTPSEAGPKKGTPEYDIESGEAYKRFKAEQKPIINTNEINKSINLNNKDNLNDLIQQFEQLKNKNPNYDNYVTKLKDIDENSSDMEKSQMEFNLMQQPAFRQYMKGKDVKK